MERGITRGNRRPGENPFPLDMFLQSKNNTPFNKNSFTPGRPGIHS